MAEIKRVTIDFADGSSQVVVGEPLPTPEPIPQPTPEPAPQPEPTPTPTPTPGVPDNAKRIDPGADLAKLDGAVALRPGGYVTSGLPKPGLKLYTLGLHDSTLNLRDGQQFGVSKGGPANVLLQGLRIIGGGSGKHNDAAAVLTWDGWQLVDVLIEKAKGTGLCIQGSGVRALRFIAQDCAASGRGGNSAKDYEERDCITRRNNAIAKDGDGGGGKMLRTQKARIHNLTSTENTGVGIWWDYRNSDVQMLGGLVSNNRHWQRNTSGWNLHSLGRGIYIEWNAPQDGKNGGGFVIDGVTVKGNDGAQIDIAESANVTVRNCTIEAGKLSMSDYGIAFRNINRDEGGTIFENVLQNILIENNKLANCSIRRAEGSNASKGRNKIRTVGNVFVGSGSDKIPA